MGIWQLLEAVLMITNALAILNEDRFLVPHGWGFSEMNNGRVSSVKSQIIGLLHAVQYLRGEDMILALDSSENVQAGVHLTFFSHQSITRDNTGRQSSKWENGHDDSGLWRLSNNERDFVNAVLLAELRVDGRRPFDARWLIITFAKQDGAVEVQQGETRVMAVLTGQLGSPYPDRPTEGSLTLYTEFSPMADPSFEPGRPGEMAVELGRIIDRGLRESRAVDTESLCVLAGRAVWALRLDIHILDNGGNLVDVANTAALAALLSYRRPECTIGGHDGQDL